MKYGIAMFPSKQLQDLVNSYRKRYDPHYALVPPHITIKPAFELENGEVDSFVSRVHEIAASIGPVQIEVNKVKSFQPVNNVIYLKVEEDPNLVELYHQLRALEVGPAGEYPFVPHITLAQGLSNEEHSDIIEVLKMKNIQHHETIDRFQLLYQLDNQSWTVYETFHLGKDTH
ncbi:YjcG family protein [Pullulanibacillus sp. KACC 23026]|uniref:YjcG family protein n=1 Tax=Pullulanibacillus sp. KACC 23026 TaxID=3028315 RepID=UPI0023B1BF59|nr:YjcG family protein [Pullulanibacillus sp. KACC 23026]WEG11900.1 YjcG family protein [Pullulanibacillus sp. KACC 23026]